MGYDKGKLSREQIIEAGAGVVLAKGYAATTIADLSHAAHTSAGKLTHHFPTKGSLFEAIFGSLMEGMEAGPLATLADAALSPEKRIHGFLDGMYRLYAKTAESDWLPSGPCGQRLGWSFRCNEGEGAQNPAANHQPS